MSLKTTRAAGHHTSGARKAAHTLYHDYMPQLPPIEIGLRPLKGTRRFEDVDDWEPNVFDDLIEGGSLAEVCAFHSRRLLQAVHDHASERGLRDLLTTFWQAVAP